jgi:hypothetical protein
VEVRQQRQRQQSLVVVAVVLRLSLRQQAVLQVVLVEQDKSVEAVVPLQLAQRLRLELSLLELVALEFILVVLALL